MRPPPSATIQPIVWVLNWYGMEFCATFRSLCQLIVARYRRATNPIWQNIIRHHFGEYACSNQLWYSIGLLHALVKWAKGLTTTDNGHFRSLCHFIKFSHLEWKFGEKRFALKWIEMNCWLCWQQLKCQLLLRVWRASSCPSARSLCEHFSSFCWPIAWLFCSHSFAQFHTLSCQRFNGNH